MPASRHFLAALVILACSARLAGAQDGAARDPDDPFARYTWNFQLASSAVFEIWNYNGNHEEMYAFVPGVTYGLSDAVAFIVTLPMQYVNQRGVDASMQGLTIGLRARVYRRGRTSVYFDVDVGWSYADTFTPPRGTRFNYLAIGTVGVMRPVARGLHAMAGARLVHVSNNGLAGRDRNPDIEALGLHVGVLRRF